MEGTAHSYVPPPFHRRARAACQPRCQGWPRPNERRIDAFTGPVRHRKHHREPPLSAGADEPDLQCRRGVGKLVEYLGEALAQPLAGAQAQRATAHTSVATCRVLSAAASTARASGSRRCPAAVSRTCREVRSNKVTPSSRPTTPRSRRRHRRVRGGRESSKCETGRR
jgi:hypothetical protein